MCGISGVLTQGNWAHSARALVDGMNEALEHRGPNGCGHHDEPPVILGHRRLSIIDVKTGQQPMSNEDGRVWVTYNGELYNFRELRAELAGKGHRFRTSSDTEVVVHAWEEWGESCVERFQGMFALAVADYRRRILFLARDQIGIKPLYYTFNAQRFAFASEMQALKCLPDLNAKIDIQSMDQYLRLDYVPAPRTIFTNVSKLEPAHRMTVSFDGRTTGAERYWKLRYQPEHGLSDEDWTDRLEAVLRESVRAHLVADVPFGAFLSGGLDSTTVVGLMAEEMREPVKTFSIGFEEEINNELPYASIVARRFGTDHYTEVVKPDALGILSDLVRGYGEPFGDNSAIPTYYVSQLARAHVPMVLSGDGGDEAFGGYSRYKNWARHVSGPKRRPLWKRALRSPLEKCFPNKFRVEPRRNLAVGEQWMAYVQVMSHDTRRSLWRSEYRHVIEEPVEAFRNLEHANGCPEKSLAQLFDYHTYLPYDILTKVDIASMMNSLEVRTPMVDVRVAEFAATMPFDVNFRFEGPDGWSGKRILKRIVAKNFDCNFVNRPKSGFGMPLKNWITGDRDTIGNVKDRLLSRDAAILEHLEPSSVKRLIGAQVTRQTAKRLWRLLFLEEWLHQYKQSP